MTRDEAIVEAQRQQRLHPQATWIATERDNEWTVARIGLPPTVKPTGTATKPPPTEPQADPQTPLQRVSNLYG